MITRDLVVLGASWGGLYALGEVLAGLPSRFPAAIAIAQHRGPDLIAGQLSHLLDGRGTLTVLDAEDKDPVRPGCVYLAPPDYHLLVEPGGFSLSVDEPVAFSRPSIDVLFESAADAFGDRLVGVVLTGANEDGAAWVSAIKRHGGVTIAQDPEEAERSEMPRAAIETGSIDRILPVAEIPPALVELCGER